MRRKDQYPLCNVMDLLTRAGGSCLGNSRSSHYLVFSRRRRRMELKRMRKTLIRILKWVATVLALRQSESNLCAGADDPARASRP